MGHLGGLLLGSLLLLAGCATTETDSPSEGGTAERTHYTLRQGEAVIHGKPLPHYYPIWVDWHLSDGTVESELGFRGWDFSEDGRIDYLEVLTSDGDIVRRVYDFNFDGILDHEQVKTSKRD